MAHASADMPYFINPSINLDRSQKVEAYNNALNELSALLDGESDITVIMSSINCILKTNLSYFYWVGFYIAHGSALKVGPYQGTLGCLDIEFGRGVCGRVAQSESTIRVDDVHALSQGKDHIACDPNSQSEIVVPVRNNRGKLIAVFDVDSSVKNSFDDIDQKYLEQIMTQFFSKRELTSTLQGLL